MQGGGGSASLGGPLPARRAHLRCAPAPCTAWIRASSAPIGYPIVKAVRTEGRYARPGGGKFVHVDDVAAATVAALGNPAADGSVYNLADCYARWADWALIIAQELGVDAEIDQSSPRSPQNVFTKDAVAADLGVGMDRGMDGIRSHVAELVGKA